MLVLSTFQEQLVLLHYLYKKKENTLLSNFDGHMQAVSKIHNTLIIIIILLNQKVNVKWIAEINILPTLIKLL